MSSAFIREGDTTSHGGRVLACTSTNIVFGKPLALEGDMVSCPKCGGVYPIIGVRVRSMTFGGRAVATDGDKTACGATLIASQGQATVEPTSGAGGAGGAIGAGKSVRAQNVAQDDGAYRGRFQLVDDKTREPIANHPYTVTSADGKTVQGTTDASGHTDWLSSHQASSLSFQQPGSSE
ncbi:PAAR domain-containing protein [Burkholderia cenocepacia]|uniref:PAAR domain-containing protein n=1 Tax=Burkholderia cenocepacia TaxID=95486 RepID=UPI000F5AFD18|nr:PAAR domain-containing protein [Burkholderia cenocepacia]MBO1852319.1 PAAR domain-containing protein [Burkholderia cenocepacia]MBR8372255.1 PAAR domain-containing protein [Burkholderia cenocepacia]MBR8432520.1 PAAR domain-containing protein [Burkholderia cenocepacia]MBR8441243.1 PAAR domain-containing protein [Burkholderia cenocepacia]MCO8325771.1 PAAR domain-containing protein [Burkholderia cenocepacia]